MRFVSTLSVCAALLLGAFAAAAQTVLIAPYVQPGDGSTLGARDVKVIAWLTDQTPGTFTVEFGVEKKFDHAAVPAKVELNFAPKQKYFKYAATLVDLPLNAQVSYRVRQGAKAIREGTFATRKTPDQTVTFAVVGDTADGKPDSRVIAHQMWLAKPEFALIVGDIVYSRGLFSEYLTNFWPVYNDVATPGPKTGAPLLQSTVLYPVLGNHDVAATNLGRTPDGFGAFYFFHPPLNGPKAPTLATPIGGTPAEVAAFKTAVGDTHPSLGIYSFDNGPVHFLCLDGNRQVHPADPALTAFIERDLTQTKAAWKFAFFHHPGFHSSSNHYTEQKMRLLSPLFEKCGVDVVFAGHVHNYQRSKPLKFAPEDPAKFGAKGLVPGKFTLDEKFDGAKQTVADGVIYLVTGGGGAGLYGKNLNAKPELWQRDKTTWAPYTVKHISDRHSFTLVQATPTELTIRQISRDGDEVDRLRLTHRAP